MDEKQKQTAELIIKEMTDLAEEIYKEPEIGFQEFATAAKVLEKLKKYDIPVKSEVAYTGLVSTLSYGKEGPHIALICELDAVPTPGHLYANPNNHAAHTCGHYSQIGVMLAVFCTLKKTGLLEKLGGSVSLIATPAEEYCDFDYRQGLVEEGKIVYLSGKQEMIRLGVFDDVDIILSCHTLGTGMPFDCELGAGLNGFLCKKAVFHGKAAHAGSYPQDGINALNAANLSMTAIHFLRETFWEEDKVRVHFILSEGGQTVNTVPKQAVMDIYVRAKTTDAILKINEKVENCLKAGALAIGCGLEITDRPGYFPLAQDKNLTALVEKHVKNYICEERILRGNHGFASGDMGDLSLMWPIVEIGTGGFSGTLHGVDFKTEDESMAYTIPAQYFLDVIEELLDKDGLAVKEIVSSYSPAMTKCEYLSTLDRLKKTVYYAGEQCSLKAL